MNWRILLSGICAPLLLLAGCDANSSSDAPISATRARMEAFVPVPPGSIPRGTTEMLKQNSPPGPPINRQMLAQGRAQYDVFCSPCHGFSGYGDGVVIERGFPAPPSFHTAQQQVLSRARIVQVITNGFGRMYPLADPILPQDRWAIAAYVKALQLSQSAPIDQLPADLREQVQQ